jgi:hypothetical protein
MRLQDSHGVYHVLEAIFKAASEPITCNEVFESPEVKKFASTANRVSDYLGHMYRRGVLGRVPAPKNLYDQSRWAYFWKASDRRPSAVANQKHAVTSAVSRSKANGEMILKRPNVEISETGSHILIELPDLVITIRKK